MQPIGFCIEKKVLCIFRKVGRILGYDARRRVIPQNAEAFYRNSQRAEKTIKTYSSRSKFKWFVFVFAVLVSKASLPIAS
jgi:hypothetical protein